MPFSLLNRLAESCRRVISKFTLSGTVVWSLLLVAALIAWGVAGRLWIDTPNFKSIGAAALIAGFLLRDVRWAIAVPLLTLAISNLWLGGYPLGVAFAVYGSTVIYSLLGVWAGGRQANSAISGLLQTLGLTVVGSMQFFLLTNFAVWFWSGWYGPSLSEGVQCFVAAIPFYKWTLLGDLLFFALPMSCWFAIVRPALQPYSLSQPSIGWLISVLSEKSRRG
ncbi:MAG: DUF6580 family putative transport protein [Planctomycetota bacterium]